MKYGDRRRKDLRYSPIGPWSTVIRNIGELPRDIKTVYALSQLKILTRLVNIVKKHIFSDDLELIPKEKPNNDPRPLIDTQSYVSAIRVWRDNYRGYAGVKRGVYEAKSGIEISRLGWMLEKGTDKMPARPHWEPSITEMGGESGIIRLFRDDIYSKLKSKHGFDI